MIKIEDLSVAFNGTNVVEHVNITINPGEIVGIVGESGSGKSVTALTLMGLLPENGSVTSGKIVYDDTVLLQEGVEKDKALYREYQGSKMSMVFQEPMTSLNPTMKIGRQAAEVLRLHADMDEADIKSKVLASFKDVGLMDAERVHDSYPHQLSGGMRQRVMIAMAVMMEPGLVVADEPTTALDVTVQNQIIELLREINKKKNNSMLFITHDLNLARSLCHRIVVMKDGSVVEDELTESIFTKPSHPYTKLLIDRTPSRHKKKKPSELHGNNSGDFVLEVNNLDVYYKNDKNSLFSSAKNKKKVVKGASFEIRKGEILGLVGESGCGKTTLSKAILGINKYYTGSIVHNTSFPKMIFQDPYSSLNPSKSIGWLLQEPLRALKNMSKDDMNIAAHDMLKKIELDERYFNMKPSELSGGQRQRVSIGQALITNPGFIIADEPVSALDVTIQAQIMELMLKLQEEMKLSYLFISHDINVIYQMSDRIMVMKDGCIIETGYTQDVFDNPREDYTKELLRSNVELGLTTSEM